MIHKGRWWLEPKHEKARCQAHVPGESSAGRQCRNMAFRGGFCKLHQKKPLPVCPKCKRPL